MKQAGIPAFALAGVCIVSATVLQALGHPSTQLWTVAIAITGGAVGITIPDLGTQSVASPTTLSTAAGTKAANSSTTTTLTTTTAPTASVAPSATPATSPAALTSVGGST